MPHATRKILFVNHEVGLGGAERSLIDLIANLDRTSFAAHLACSREGPLEAAARAHGAKVHLVPMLFDGRLRKAVGLWRAASQLRGLIAQESIDLVHANTLIAGYAALRAARAAGVPLVWHVRDIDYPAAGRFACRRADRVIANSAATAQSLGIDGVRVIHNGVDLRAFGGEQGGPSRRAEVRAELGVPAGEKIVGMIGRLDRWKGHRVLLEAAAAVRAPATFVIVGDVILDGSRHRLGGYRAELERAAGELGVGRRVVFLGERGDVPRLLSAFDVLVHPSLAPEPFGRTIIEAQAAGLPVVASACGGIPEIVTDGVDGFLTPPGDAVALAAAIERLLGDDGLRDRIGQAARANARDRFSFQHHGQAVAAVWDELLCAGAGIGGAGIGDAVSW